MFDGLLGNVLLGLSTAFEVSNLLYCLLGVALGMFIGILPGIGALSAISLLFPLTFHMQPTEALIMLAGIFYGSSYGGSTSAILLNVPGGASSAVTCLDGYPMSKQGRGGIALLLTTVASFVAGSIGIVLMMLFSPLVVEMALTFTSAEYFSLMVLGLVAASMISDGSPVKSIAMVVLGVLLGLVGLDLYTGAQRFTFGTRELYDGLSLVALAMGLFGVAEIIASVKTGQAGRVQKVTLRSMIPTRDDIRRSVGPTLRGSAIGSFFGTLPGTGASIASFLSYAVEKRISKDPSRFGKGAVEGICAPEAANNAADQTAFIPTMTLGIPGSPTMALMFGVLLIHGIAPGPQLISVHPDIFWGLVMSFWVGNLLLLVLNIPLIGVWVRMLQIPYHLLYPVILMFVCIGLYSVQTSAFEVWSVLILGIVGYGMRALAFPAAPLLLGFVLGPMVEENFRRAMIVSSGRFEVFIERPVSGALLACTLAVLVWGFWSFFSARRRVAAAA